MCMFVCIGTSVCMCVVCDQIIFAPYLCCYGSISNTRKEAAKEGVVWEGCGYRVWL